MAPGAQSETDMLQQSLKKIVDVLARKHGLQPAIAWGVCGRESGFDIGATRYEAGYRWLVRDRRLKPANCSDATEIMMQKTSWGLMQVMGAVLREQGFEGWLNQISCDPAAQVEYGCRHLAKAIRRWGSVEAGLAAYNAGSPRRTATGRFVNQHYVDDVMPRRANQ